MSWVAKLLLLAMLAQPQEQPLMVELQHGSQVRVRMDSRVRRVSVADETIADITADGRDVLVRSKRVGRTFVILTMEVGRRLMSVVVQEMPRERRTVPPPGHRYRDIAQGDSLYSYRALVSGRLLEQSDPELTAHRHTLNTWTPVGRATVSSVLDLESIQGGDTRIIEGTLRYIDPRFEIAGGDVQPGALSQLVEVQRVRGGYAAYHDPKYELRAFGGMVPAESEGVYGTGDGHQEGMLLDVYLTRDVRVGINAVHAARDLGGARLDRRFVAAPSMSFNLIPQLSIDAELAASSDARAGRVQARFDSPVVTLDGYVRALGADFDLPGAPPTTTLGAGVQVSPSTFYDASVRGSRTIRDDVPWGSEDEGVGESLTAAARIFPAGRGSTFFLIAQHSQSDAQFFSSGARRFELDRERTSIDLNGRLSSAPGSRFGVAVVREIVADASIAESPLIGEYVESQQRSAHGLEGEVWYPFGDSGLALGASAGYEMRDHERQVEDLGSSHTSQYIDAGPRLVYNGPPWLVQVNSYYGHERFDNGANIAFAAVDNTCTFRPSASHELQLSVSYVWQSADTAAPVYMFGDRQNVLSGYLAYTHYQGSATDTPLLFGLFESSSVRVVAFLDDDEDGELDAGEQRYGGVRVVMGQGEDETVTDANGVGAFTGLRAGKYFVRVDASSTDGLKFTTPSSRHVRVGDNDDSTFHIGLSNRGRIYLVVFNDVNLDGTRQPTEPGLSRVGVDFALRDGRRTRHTTDALGAIQFGKLAAGQYSIVVDPRSFPAQYVLSNGTNGHGKDTHEPNGYTNGNGNGHRKQDVVLAPGDMAIVSVPVKALRIATGRVFVDLNGNGRFDGQDTPLGGVTVRFDGRYAVTDDEGNYLFRSLPAGALAVRVDPTTLPSGLEVEIPQPFELTLSHGPSTHNIDFPLSPL